MTQIMNAAAEMTDEQIENVVSKLRDAMRKHRSSITSDVAQQVLGVENLGMIMFTPFRERAEAVSNIIVRRVPVKRGRTQQEAIQATGRTQYTDCKIVDMMPKGEGDETEVVFFKPDLSQRQRFISDDDLNKEYELRGLKPADPISVAAVNEEDPTFADEKPHSTHWRDAQGNWCYAAFLRSNGNREVFVFHHVVLDRDDSWWFAGLRK